MDTGSADGVMLLLSPAIDKKTIRWKEHLKGRLIQASFSWHGARVHVLIAYQHVWSSQKSVHQNKEDRAKLLGSLASAPSAIPARDTLLLAGDFNAQLHASQNLVGRSSTLKENTGVRDESFQRFVGGVGIPQIGGAQHLEQWPRSHLRARRVTHTDK